MLLRDVVVALALLVAAKHATAQDVDPMLVRARAFLKANPLIDGHNDLPIVIRRAGIPPGDGDAYDIARPGAHETDIPRPRAGGVGAQFWSVYVPSDLGPLEAMHTQLEQIDIARRRIAKYPGDLRLVTTAVGIREEIARWRIASLLGMEGGHTLANSLGPSAATTTWVCGT